MSETALVTRLRQRIDQLLDERELVRTRLELKERRMAQYRHRLSAQRARAEMWKRRWRQAKARRG